MVVTLKIISVSSVKLGAVKVGLIAVSSLKVTPVLVTSDHKRLTSAVDADESRVTVSPALILLWSAPASAMLGVGVAEPSKPPVVKPLSVPWS